MYKVEILIFEYDLNSATSLSSHNC